MLKISQQGLRRLILSFVMAGVAIVLIEGLVRAVDLSEIALLLAFTLLTLGASLFIVNVMIENARVEEMRLRVTPNLEEIALASDLRLRKLLSVLELLYNRTDLDWAAQRSIESDRSLRSCLLERNPRFLAPSIPTTLVRELIGVCADPSGSLDKEVREASTLIPPELKKSLRESFGKVQASVGLLESVISTAGPDLESLFIAEYLSAVYDSVRALGVSAQNQWASD